MTRALFAAAVLAASLLAPTTAASAMDGEGAQPSFFERGECGHDGRNVFLKNNSPNERMMVRYRVTWTDGSGNEVSRDKAKAVKARDAARVGCSTVRANGYHARARYEVLSWKG